MMELKKLTVHNYKSLVNFELNEPNAFTVFAGPNGAGKSNIFEAVEFGSYQVKFHPSKVESLFGGKNSIINVNSKEISYRLKFVFDNYESSVSFRGKYGKSESNSKTLIGSYSSKGFDDYNKKPFTTFETFDRSATIQKKFFGNFIRLFINKSEFNRIRYTSDEQILPDASNLESVLKRLLKDKSIKEEFLEWLDLLVPGFENIEIHSDNIGGTDTMLIYEEGTSKPFTKNLISDGTYNILALLTAVYQTDEPQFLCIEEPENGLNPYVVETFVDFFRRQCEEKGHVIWLNTHSQTLVKHLRPEELVLVEKKNGETVIKQFPADYNLRSFTMDEAWLTNVLGGGLPW